MAHSDFYRMDRVHENVAEGADLIRDESGTVVGWKKNIYSFPPVGSPDAGAHVTARDMDRFLRAVQAGALLSPERTEALLTPHVLYRSGDEWTRRYGFVLEFYEDKGGRTVYYQKDGINAGVSGILRHYPDRDINVILLSNMEDGVWQPIRRLHEWVMAGRLDRP
jgi:hypothetical protein